MKAKAQKNGGVKLYEALVYDDAQRINQTKDK